MENKPIKKILAFGAHPDDVEFGCGGLLLKEIKNGAQVKIVIGSLGEAGTNGTPESRKAEAEAAAKFIGAEIEFLDMGGDCHILNTPANTIRLAEIIRTYQPDIVLAPSLTENQHPDHRVLAEMVRAAARFARYGGLSEIKNLPVHSIDALYFYPSSAEFDTKPDVVIDVSAEYDDWVKAIEAVNRPRKHKDDSKPKSDGSKVCQSGANISTLYSTDTMCAGH